MGLVQSLRVLKTKCAHNCCGNWSHTGLHTGEDCYAGNDGSTATVAPVVTVAPTKAAATVAPTKPVVAKPTAKPVVVPVPGDDETVAPTAVSLSFISVHCIAVSTESLTLWRSVTMVSDSSVVCL
jgi:hypothetical protein